MYLLPYITANRASSIRISTAITFNVPFDEHFISTSFSLYTELSELKYGTRCIENSVLRKSPARLAFSGLAHLTHSLQGSANLMIVLVLEVLGKTKICKY